MATGYTCSVQDGTIKDFRTFALRCARAFSPLIEMRDDDMDEPIPDEFKPSTYRVTALAHAQLELARLQKMGVAQADRAAAKAYADSLALHVKAEKKRQEEQKRYEAMLSKVHAWKPPTLDHAGLKRFMEEQLAESIQFDCGDFDQFKPKPSTGPAWLAKQIERAENDVEYHTKELALEKKRANERTQWVRDLRNSL